MAVAQPPASWTPEAQSRLDDDRADRHGPDEPPVADVDVEDPRAGVDEGADLVTEAEEVGRVEGGSISTRAPSRASSSARSYGRRSRATKKPDVRSRWGSVSRNSRRRGVAERAATALRDRQRPRHPAAPDRHAPRLRRPRSTTWCATSRGLCGARSFTRRRGATPASSARSAARVAQVTPQMCRLARDRDGNRLPVPFGFIDGGGDGSRLQAAEVLGGGHPRPPLGLHLEDLYSLRRAPIRALRAARAQT